MCYQGNCVNSAPYFSNVAIGNPCIPNPCQNGGLCIQNATTSTLYCRCSANKIYTGIIKVKIKFPRNLLYFHFVDLLCSVPTSYYSIVLTITTTTTTTITTTTTKTTTKTITKTTTKKAASG